jgi:hypothetical protein
LVDDPDDGVALVEGDDFAPPESLCDGAVPVDALDPEDPDESDDDELPDELDPLDEPDLPDDCAARESVR